MAMTNLIIVISKEILLQNHHKYKSVRHNATTPPIFDKCYIYSCRLPISNSFCQLCLFIVMHIASVSFKAYQ